jgi:hypothetical protein
VQANLLALDFARIAVTRPAFDSVASTGRRNPSAPGMMPCRTAPAWPDLAAANADHDVERHLMIGQLQRLPHAPCSPSHG